MQSGNAAGPDVHQPGGSVGAPAAQRAAEDRQDAVAELLALVVVRGQLGLDLEPLPKGSLIAPGGPGHPNPSIKLLISNPCLSHFVSL